MTPLAEQRARDRTGLVSRAVYAVIPPRVEYTRTTLGDSLGEVISNVWQSAEAHLRHVTEARETFDASVQSTPGRK